MRPLGTLALLLLLTACAGPAAPTNPPSPQATRFQTVGPLPSASVPSGSPVSVPEAKLQAIRTDLAGRGVNADQLEVVSAESVTFNDGSLGCPQPGVQYTQAQVDGMRVVVSAGGTNYDYRFGNTDSPHLCENRGPRATETTR